LRAVAEECGWRARVEVFDVIDDLRMRDPPRAGDRGFAIEVGLAGIDHGQASVHVVDQLELTDRAYARRDRDRLDDAPSGVDQNEAVTPRSRHPARVVASRHPLEAL
jgi:hypothetical protein